MPRELRSRSSTSVTLATATSSPVVHTLPSVMFHTDGPGHVPHRGTRAYLHASGASAGGYGVRVGRLRRLSAHAGGAVYEAETERRTRLTHARRRTRRLDRVVRRRRCAQSNRSWRLPRPRALQNLPLLFPILHPSLSSGPEAKTGGGRRRNGNGPEQGTGVRFIHVREHAGEAWLASKLGRGATRGGTWHHNTASDRHAAWRPASARLEIRASFLV